MKNIFFCGLFLLTSCSLFVQTPGELKCMKDQRTNELFYLRSQNDTEFVLDSVENRRHITVAKPTTAFEEVPCVLQDKFKTIH